MTPSIITTTRTASQPPIPPTPIPNRVKSLEVNFSEFMRTNQFPEAVSNIPAILKRRREDDDDQEGPNLAYN
nr:hypothetical protein [Tanacetum cinerariifolium]